MKRTITTEVDEDFLAYEDGEIVSRPYFCVTAQCIVPYYNRDNYRCFNKEDPEKLQSETIDYLYEQMARVRVDHTLQGERQCRDNSYSQLDVKDFTVEFSDIFIEVESYDEARLKTTTCWKNLGEAREKQQERELLEVMRARAASQAWEAKRKEEHDRAEFARLSQKYKQ